MSALGNAICVGALLGAGFSILASPDSASGVSLVVAGVGAALWFLGKP